MSERDVEIVIRARDMLQGVIDRAAKQVDELGAKAESSGLRGREGFNIFGKSAETLANQLGVPFRAANTLGNKIEDMAARTFPAWGIAFGAVGAAVAGAVMVVKHFNDEAEKQSQAIKRAGDSAIEYVSSISSAIGITKDLEKAQWDQAKTQLIIEKSNIKKAIREYTDELSKLEQQNKKTWSTGAAGMTEEDFPLTSKINNLNAKITVARNSLIDIDRLLNLPKSPKEIKKESDEAEKDRQLQLQVERSEKIAAMKRWEALESEMATARVLDGDRAAQAEYGRLMEQRAQWAQYGAAIDEVTAYSTQARVNIATAAYRGMEVQLMRLVEVHKFSATEFAKAVANAVKAELIGVAARASVWAIYYTGMGLGAAATGNAASAGLYFAAAGEMAAVAGATLAAAAAVNAITGPTGKTAGGAPAGTTPTSPEFVTPAGATNQSTQNMNVYVTINNPLANENWQHIIEKNVVPALNEAADRGVQLKQNIIMLS